VTLLLALETATRATSVALLRGEELLAEESGESDRNAAETLLPAVDALLRGAGIAVSELAAFAVSIGPGSFTGLRVGLATVKGLAFGSDRLVLPVPTLAALADTAPRRDLPVAALIDARRGEMYAGVFDVSGELPETILPVGVFTPAELVAELPPECLLVGEGVPLFGPEIRQVRGPGVLLAPGDPRAAVVGRLGARMLARGGGLPAAGVVPHYVRRADAEVKRTGVRFEPERGRQQRGRVEELK